MFLTSVLLMIVMEVTLVHISQVLYTPETILSCPHFIDEKTEAQRGEAACTRPRSLSVTKFHTLSRAVSAAS